MTLATRLLLAAGLAATLAVTGCGNNTPPSGNAGNGHTEDDGHDHGDEGHDEADHADPGHEDHDASSAGHGGPVIELGTASQGGFEIRATRDDAPINAGGDAAFDVTVTPAAGSTARVAAVRFWVGTQDAVGSTKARAEIENSAEPNRWHTHAEIPSPIPAGSMLWIQIEVEGGQNVVLSFDLKM